MIGVDLQMVGGHYRPYGVAGGKDGVTSPYRVSIYYRYTGLPFGGYVRRGQLPLLGTHAANLQQQVDGQR
jgi:hypothetical protein